MKNEYTIKIAVCDDFQFMREEAKKHILRYSIKKELNYSLDEYETGEKLLESGKKYDLIFMDYEFGDKGADGLTISKELRKRGDDATIIFLSGYTDIAYKTFEVKVFRFLTKPIEEEIFDNAMDSFLKPKDDDTYLTVRVGGITHCIKESRILCIEGRGKHCRIHFTDRDEALEWRETLASVEERLSAHRFYRCYKSYVVNLSYVEAYSRKEVILEQDFKIPMSRAKYEDFSTEHTFFIMRNM